MNPDLPAVNTPSLPVPEGLAGSVHSLKRGRPGNPTIVQGVGSTVRRESTPPLIPILEVSLFTSLQGKSFLLYSLATLEVHLFFITRRR